MPQKKSTDGMESDMTIFGDVHSSSNVADHI